MLGRSLPLSGKKRKFFPLTAQQPILPRRRLRHRRPPLHRQSPRRRRIRHCLLPPRLQHPRPRTARRPENPHRANLVLRPQRRDLRRSRGVHPHQRDLPRARRRDRPRTAARLHKMGPLLRPQSKPLLGRGDHPAALGRAAGSIAGAGGYLQQTEFAHGAGCGRYSVLGEFAYSACADGVYGSCAAGAEEASYAALVGDAGG